jgi:hypothetical protein
MFEPYVKLVITLSNRVFSNLHLLTCTNGTYAAKQSNLQVYMLHAHLRCL